MRKVLILGATSAIARYTARLFAADHDTLFLVGRNAERLEAVAADLRTRGASGVHTRVVDLNALESHERLVSDAAAAMDGLDVALIAHGTLGDQKACEKDFALAEQEIRTNFLSAASLMTHLANHLEGKRSGTVAVISSVAGDRGRMSNYVYGSAKAGLSAFAAGMRNRLHASGVALVTVKPGFVDTPMTANVKKGALFARPEDVARGIHRAILRRKDVVYLPSFWWGIMWIIRAIPERVFKRLKL